MNVAALWHDLECGGYREDLALWRSLVAQTGGPVLDVGAGTGRVTLELAASGVPVVALDVEVALLAALRYRARGLPVETVVADARRFTLRQRFSLVLVPMQTLQLLGGRRGRVAFLRCALAHLRPGGLLAATVADAMGCFDDEHDTPPPPDALEVAGMRFASQLLAVVEDDGRAAIHRRREIVGPHELARTEDVVVRLDRVSANEVEVEAARLGFVVEPQREVPETDRYLGSTIVMLRARRRLSAASVEEEGGTLAPRGCLSPAHAPTPQCRGVGAWGVRRRASARTTLSKGATQMKIKCIVVLGLTTFGLMAGVAVPT